MEVLGGIGGPEAREASPLYTEEERQVDAEWGEQGDLTPEEPGRKRSVR